MRLHKFLVLLFIFHFSLFAPASAQKYIADKVVAVVGSMPILYSDVVERAAQMKVEQPQAEGDPLSAALENLLEQKLLYQRAQLDSIGIESFAPRIAEMVEGNVSQMIAEAGSIRALEMRERKPLYTIKEDMRGRVEEYYAASEMNSIVRTQVKVTPGEVDKFYRAVDPDSLPMVPEQYVYAQITRLPEGTEFARQRARERLLELRERIVGGERFDRLAMMYSVDGGSAMRGGEMDPAPKESFVEPFANALAKLRPGQVSGVVETEFGFHIIQLIDKPAENLYHLRHILIKPSYTSNELTGMLTFLDSLADVIRRGEITFERAALLNSDDAATRMNGGVVSNQEMLFRYYGNADPTATRTRFSKEELDPTDATYITRMKPGEISRAFLGRDFRMDEMGKILKLNEIVPSHRANLAEDYLDIEQMALMQKQQSHYAKWLDGKIDEMYVRIDPMFKKENFKNKKWFK